MALSKTGRFLSKAEILGVGVLSPLPISLPMKVRHDSLNVSCPGVLHLQHVSGSIKTELCSAGCLKRLAKEDSSLTQLLSTVKPRQGGGFAHNGTT